MMDLDLNNFSKIEVGSLIANRYEVIKKLGEGGMGKVYKVLDKDLDDDVLAVKVLDPSLAFDKVQFGRFRYEVLLARQLSHPRIIKIYDLASVSKVCVFICMEYLEGGVLTDRIYSKGVEKCTNTEFSKILLQIADGLSEAHSQNIIHRDLKPDNILLDKDLNIKITDFGLAKSMYIDKNFTLTGETVGTPHYMSPEQLAGDELTTAADIYSLGVMFYEMLFSKRPYISDNYFDLARLHMESPIPNILDLNPNLPKWMPEFINLSLAKDKDKRFKDGEETVDFLIRVLDPSIIDSIDRVPKSLFFN